jgi:predicted RNase H-like HicB family nuclease
MGIDYEATPSHGYSARVFWSHEDNGYIAVCPDLQGISNASAFGDTRERALKELDVAIGLVLEELRASGVAIPDPIGARTYSGKFNVRVSKTLHQQIAAAAENDDVSLNTKVVELLSSGLAAGSRRAAYSATPRRPKAAARKK